MVLAGFLCLSLFVVLCLLFEMLIRHSLPFQRMRGGYSFGNRVRYCVERGGGASFLQ